MAKALTKPSKASEGHERELRRLRLSVCDDTGFRLYLATYDQPKRRDELIKRIVREAEAEKARVTRLDLAEGGTETSLVALLRAHLAKTNLRRGWRHAVMVTGIEQRIHYSGAREGLAFMRQANLLRDALPGAAPVPVVLWLSRMASAVLPEAAPDLWHWRAANFDFTGDEAPRAELLRELTTVRPEDDLAMSGDQRRARVRMLADLLAEIEREGAPASKRQASARARLLADSGLEYWKLGHAAEAVPIFERALALFRAAGDRPGEAAALVGLGLAWKQRGEARRAIDFHEQVLAIARAIGDRRAEGAALGNLGVAWADLGEARRAIDFHERHLAIAREIGDRIGEGYALGHLGVAWADLGEPRRAIDFHEQVLAIARETRDRGGEGAALGNLGNAWAVLGEPRRAIELYEQQLALAREIGDRRGEGAALFNAALVFAELGERGEAVRRMESALRIYAIIDDPGQSHAQAMLKEWQGQDVEAG